MFRAPHIAHVPLQVPSQFYDRFADLPEGDLSTHPRQIYEAMTNFADTAIGNLTRAMDERQMWNDTLLIFTSVRAGCTVSTLSAAISLNTQNLADKFKLLTFCGAG